MENGRFEIGEEDADDEEVELEPVSQGSDWDSDMEKNEDISTGFGDEEEELSRFVCQLYDSIFREGASLDVALKNALASNRKLRQKDGCSSSYFTKFELEPQGVGRSWRSYVQVEKDCSNGHSRPGFWFSITGWRRKKQIACNNNNGGFLPSMCSATKVADMNRYNRIPGFNYRILKNDVHNFHV
ncbi:hypothetical protein V6N12_063078 [Hibiscus sabdariffa]|uniref:Uncharacterized protein n=1 Tax=Hibiscus sabdariffa TaxID=183260 RepID=A0ABR2FAS6_9ROSI